MNKRKQRMQEIVRFVETIKDADGFAVIDVNLTGGAELYNPLSVPTEREINPEIYDYIDAQANLIPAEIPLRVRFHGTLKEDEQAEIRASMMRHYNAKSYDILWDMAANFRKMMILVVLGVAVLAAYFYFSLASDQFFFAEILSIVGSFSLWEAADALLLERPHLKRELKNIEQNLNQRVEFVDDAA